MVNFLALLGWSPGTDEELFTKAELVDRFSLEGISGGNAVFNPDKLDWFNQQQMMRLPAGELANRIAPLLRDAGLWRDGFESSDRRMTKSSMLALSNAIGPCTRSVNEVRPSGTLNRTARGVPASFSRAISAAGSAQQVRS